MTNPPTAVRGPTSNADAFHVSQKSVVGPHIRPIDMVDAGEPAAPSTLPDAFGRRWSRMYTGESRCRAAAARWDSADTAEHTRVSGRHPGAEDTEAVSAGGRDTGGQRFPAPGALDRVAEFGGECGRGVANRANSESDRSVEPRW